MGVTLLNGPNNLKIFSRYLGHFKLIKIYGLERPEPILRENKEGEENTGDLDVNNSSPIEVNVNGLRNSNQEPHKRDHVEAWDQAN